MAKKDKIMWGDKVHLVITIGLIIFSIYLISINKWAGAIVLGIAIFNYTISYWKESEGNS